MSESLRVGPDIVVDLDYRLYDAEEALVEASGDGEALSFVFGGGQMPAAIEAAVEGLKVGDERRIVLSPDRAFGPRDEQAIVLVERGELPASIAPGDELEADSDSGEVVFLRVLAVDDDMARLDTNHPLAGQNVTLDVVVATLRPATQDEIDQVRHIGASGQAPDVPIQALFGGRRLPPPDAE